MPSNNLRSTIRRKVLLLLLIVVPVMAALVWLDPALGTRYLFDPHPDEHPTSPAERTADHLRVLFIGNSLTFAHAQVLILTRLVESARLSDPTLKPIIAEHVTQPGASLEDIWKTGSAQKRIEEGNWDFVVLQEYSKQPMAAPGKMQAFLAKFAGEAKAVGAKCVLFETWAIATRPEDQPIITQAYEDAGVSLQAAVLPIGRTLWSVIQDHPRLQLHDTDGRHPTPAGSYLAACMFYSFLYDRSPEGLTAMIADHGKTFVNLPIAQASILQAAASKAVREKEPIRPTTAGTSAP